MWRVYPNPCTSHLSLETTPYFVSRLCTDHVVVLVSRLPPLRR